MKTSVRNFILLISLLIPTWLSARTGDRCKITDRVLADSKNFYSLNSLWKFALGIGYAGMYANTSFDEQIQNLYQDYVKGSASDNISKVAKPFGDGRITVPVYLAAFFIGRLTKNSRCGSVIGQWGEQCSRALLVGAPQVLAFQVILGGSRPEENRGSKWRPFKDNNGVSGHGFMGAVPFLIAAKMTNHRWLKYPFYFASMLPAVSRINDNKHYFSQSFFGWWLAYLSVNSLDRKPCRRVAVTPIIAPTALGIRISWRYTD